MHNRLFWPLLNLSKNISICVCEGEFFANKDNTKYLGYGIKIETFYRLFHWVTLSYLTLWWPSADIVDIPNQDRNSPAITSAILITFFKVYPTSISKDPEFLYCLVLPSIVFL